MACKYIIGNIEYKSLEDLLVAFNPNQIKSATENIGTFSTESNDIRYQIIGEVGAQNLDQIEEATFRMDNLKVAREMEAAGKTPKEIRLATGWEKNLADQKWRYEILDGSIKDVTLNYTNNNGLFENPTANIKLSELYSNQELFKAYPKLKNTEVVFYDTKNELYNDNLLFVVEDKIYINKKDYDRQKLGGNLKNIYNGSTLEQAIAHELSHIIQTNEGFAQGSSRQFNKDLIRGSISFFRSRANKLSERDGLEGRYDRYVERTLRNSVANEVADSILNTNNIPLDLVVNTMYDRLYKNFAGEVEARNVEKRFFMSPQERLEQTLQETQDIPFEDQFVSQAIGGAQSTSRTAPQITQEIIDKLKQNGLSEDVFLLSTEEINAKLIELGVSEDVRYNIIGELGAKNLKNATRVLKNLEVAKKMKIEGKDELTIKIATGWEYNKGDKKWRIEVDSKSIYKNVSIPKSFNIFNPNEKQPLERFFKNKELFKLYPQLKEYQVMVKTSIGGNFLGGVNTEHKIIIVPFSSVYFKSTLVHEIQHVIQEEEGFAVGGSPELFAVLAENKQKEYNRITQEIKNIFKDKTDRWKDEVKPYMTEYLEVGSAEYTNNLEKLTDFDRLSNLLYEYRNIIYSSDKKFFLTPEQQYNNLAGEVEARNAQSRMDMTMEQKQNSLLSITEDVAEEDKIYIQNAITIEEQIQFSKSLNNVGINLITNGLIYKDSKTGKDIVILNKDTATDETAIHEFSHIFSKWQKENRPELWKKGQDLSKDAIKSGEIQEIVDYVKQTQPKLKEGTEAFYDEVLQQFISTRSNQLISEQKQKSPLMQWLSDFWDSIADLLNIFELSSSEIANLTLKEFSDYSISALLNNDIMLEKLVELNIIERLC